LWGPGARLHVEYYDEWGGFHTDNFYPYDAKDEWDGIHPGDEDPDVYRPPFASTEYELEATPDKLNTIRAWVIDLWGDWHWLDRGNWIIHETAWSSELVLDQAMYEEIDLFEDYLRELKIVYEVPGGRYEWTVVGRDAHSVDSIGAAMIDSAIKNKRMETGLGAMDRSLPEFDPVPSVMEPFDGDYMDDLDRTAFLDSWSTFLWDDTRGWPIETSNIAISGGPIANMAQRYFNDFNEAFWTISDYAGAGLGSTIMALTAWSKGGAAPPVTYSSSGDIGYGVICTYKDKEGTVGLSVWGQTGRDTYFTAQFFEFNKYKLQHINKHVTCIIVEINYDSSDTETHEPQFQIIHWLGTISEKVPTQDP
jgi:hypothetical protein